MAAARQPDDPEGEDVMVYPKVTEISRTDGPPPPSRPSQRELVELSLLHKPPKPVRPVVSGLTRR